VTQPGSFSTDDREYDQKEHERALRRVDVDLAESGDLDQAIRRS
jgi:hypothetical protein